MTVRLSIIACLALLVAALGCRAQESPDDRLRKAADYLWSQQGDDGGWHSETHGMLKGGQAWTPFVLYNLLQVPESVVQSNSERVDRALSFIRRHVGESGAIGLADPDVLEYPNYATSYALRVLTLVGEPQDEPLIEKMTAYLIDQQFDESRGIDSSHVAYGAWGFGETTLRPGQVGHIDLSHSRRVLQAVSETADRDVLQTAQRFLSIVQKHPDDPRIVLGGSPQNLAPYDGGFYASPVVHGTNKGGQADSAGVQYFRSYATTTSDGILSLLAAGVDRADPRIVAAEDWLRRHPSLERAGGISEGQEVGWGDVVFFYHVAVRAEAYEVLDWPGAWRATVQAILAEHQHADGRFENPMGGPNKEDDPILATALALSAMVAATGQ